MRSRGNRAARSGREGIRSPTTGACRSPSNAPRRRTSCGRVWWRCSPCRSPSRGWAAAAAPASRSGWSRRRIARPCCPPAGPSPSGARSTSPSSGTRSISCFPGSGAVTCARLGLVVGHVGRAQRVLDPGVLGAVRAARAAAHCRAAGGAGLGVRPAVAGRSSTTPSAWHCACRWRSTPGDPRSRRVAGTAATSAWGFRPRVRSR